jgi:hypothetical protein
MAASVRPNGRSSVERNRSCRACTRLVRPAEGSRSAAVWPRSAVSTSAATTSSATFAASGSRTGVDAVQTDPVQWLNTTVEEAGCHETRRNRPSPLASPMTTVRILAACTRPSMRPRILSCTHTLCPAFWAALDPGDVHFFLTLFLTFFLTAERMFGYARRHRLEAGLTASSRNRTEEVTCLPWSWPRRRHYETP